MSRVVHNSSGFRCPNPYSVVGKPWCPTSTDICREDLFQLSDEDVPFKFLGLAAEKLDTILAVLAVSITTAAEDSQLTDSSHDFSLDIVVTFHNVST